LKIVFVFHTAEFDAVNQNILQLLRFFTVFSWTFIVICVVYKISVSSAVICGFKLWKT